MMPSTGRGRVVGAGAVAVQEVRKPPTGLDACHARGLVGSDADVHASGKILQPYDWPGRTQDGSPTPHSTVRRRPNHKSLRPPCTSPVFTRIATLPGAEQPFHSFQSPRLAPPQTALRGRP